MAEQYQKSIEEFKATLRGGGVRPTMFEVDMDFPTNVAGQEKLTIEDGTFLIKAAALPASVVGVVDVPFRGRKLKVTGDRTFEDWTITVTNNVNFRLRKAFEKWSEVCQNMNYALGANNLNGYMGSAIVRQLDRQANELRVYRFQEIWPINVGSIDLNMDTTDTIEEFDVTFAVQYWTAVEEGDPEILTQDSEPVQVRIEKNIIVS